MVKRSPFNLRPILGIKKALNPKGVAVAARAIMLLADRDGRPFLAKWQTRPNSRLTA